MALGTRIMNGFLVQMVDSIWSFADTKRPGTKGGETLFFVNALDHFRTLQFSTSTCVIIISSAKELQCHPLPPLGESYWYFC